MRWYEFVKLSLFLYTVQRLKNEILEQQQRGLEEQNRLQAQVFKDMQRSHKEHVDQIIHQMEREQERMRRDNEQVLKAKLRVNKVHFLFKTCSLLCSRSFKGQIHD